MDWPKARAILLTAFTIVNLIFAYAIWGPRGLLPGHAEASTEKQVNQIRATLLEQELILPPNVAVPSTPGPMRFLHVEYRPTPDSVRLPGEFSKGDPSLKFTVDKDTQAVIYKPGASGIAQRDLKLDNRRQVQEETEGYLRQVGLLPVGASYIGSIAFPDGNHLVLEYSPVYSGYPVFSGQLRVEVSAQGIETIQRFWVEPRGYTDAPPKAVRPASEALLRLAGRLEANKKVRRTVQEIQLGYYARPISPTTQSDIVYGWDTVPVWRITLDNGEQYYINAFNGEWES